MFVLRSYRYFARVPQGSRKVPAREAASNQNEHLVTEYLAPVIYIYIHTIYIHTILYIYYDIMYYSILYYTIL